MNPADRAASIATGSDADVVDEKHANGSDQEGHGTLLEKGEETAGGATPLAKQDSNIVDWNGDIDVANPTTWSIAQKWTIIGLVSAITFASGVAPTIFAPGIPFVEAEFNTHDSSETTLLVSIFIIGLAVGPLVLAPASELYGRAVIIHVSNVVFLIASILCAVAIDIPMILVFRLVMGFAAAAPVTIGGGVIADLIEREERGRALSIWAVGPLLGPVIGPVAGGYLSLTVGWRWTYWLLTILFGILTVASFVFYRETYAPRLLSLRARRLRKQTGNVDLRSKYDNGQTPDALFRLALVRPAKMLVRCPIVLILSLYLSIVYGYTYLLFTTFTDVFEGQYGFNAGEAGLVFLGIGVGFVVAQAVMAWWSDFYLRMQKAKRGVTKPEDRLPPLLVGSLSLPIGLFWYGWTVQFRLHWIVPILGTIFCGIGMSMIILPVQIYLVDSYTIFATSALGCTTIIRSIFGACLPLAGPALYSRLGYGWGNSLLGFLALIFAPVSIILLRNGEAIREDPRFQPQL